MKILPVLFGTTVLDLLESVSREQRVKKVHALLPACSVVTAESANCVSGVFVGDPASSLVVVRSS